MHKIHLNEHNTSSYNTVMLQHIELIIQVRECKGITFIESFQASYPIRAPIALPASPSPKPQPAATPTSYRYWLRS